jgi:hypothetical protein
VNFHIRNLAKLEDLPQARSHTAAPWLKDCFAADSSV